MGCNADSPWAYNWSPTLRNLMTTFNLCDIWRYISKASEFTWQQGNNKQASRVDMSLIPQNMHDRVKKVEILLFFRSDYSYFLLEIDPPSGVKRGKGIWKLNTSHVKKQEF